MNKDTITIKYDWFPSYDHMHCQYWGWLCVMIKYDNENGTAETWKKGNWDPALYRILENSPFLIWQSIES